MANFMQTPEGINPPADPLLDSAMGLNSGVPVPGNIPGRESQNVQDARQGQNVFSWEAQISYTMQRGLQNTVQDAKSSLGMGGNVDQLMADVNKIMGGHGPAWQPPADEGGARYDRAAVPGGEFNTPNLPARY